MAIRFEGLLNPINFEPQLFSLRSVVVGVALILPQRILDFGTLLFLGLEILLKSIPFHLHLVKTRFQLQIFTVKLPREPEVIFPQLHVFFKQRIRINLNLVGTRHSIFNIPLKLLYLPLLRPQGRFMLNVKIVNLRSQIRDQLLQFPLLVAMLPHQFVDFFLLGS